jgi:hypothetical protein
MRKTEGMLQLSSAGRRFGQKLLFEDTSWLITPSERSARMVGKPEVIQMSTEPIGIRNVCRAYFFLAAR